MTTEAALAFLAQHQPMPNKPSRHKMKQFGEALTALSEDSDERAIPLLLGCYAEWEDLSLYDVIQELLRCYSREQVLPHLLAGLMDPGKKAAVFHADTARYFPHVDLIAPLARLLHQPKAYARLVAAAALERIGGGLVERIAKSALATEKDDDVQEILQTIVDQVQSQA